MIRIFCVVALLATVGAHKHDSWKHSLKTFFDALNRDIKVSLQKSVHVPPETPSGSTRAAYSTTPRPASGYASTSSPYYKPTVSTTTDCKPKKGTAEPSTRPYPVHVVGPIRGTPGVNFPDYTDIPLTSFGCSNKDYIPGFYADMETGCQVFHVCWPHRRESFLCPVGTVFNQALLACDYWYSSNCSLAPIYYNVNDNSLKKESKKDLGSVVNVLLGAGQSTHSYDKSRDSLAVSSMNSDAVLSFISQFLPVKVKVTVYPERADARSKIVATASVGKAKHRDVHHGKQTLEKSAKKLHTTSTTTAASVPPYSTQEPETSTPDYERLKQAFKRILDESYQKVKISMGDSPKLLEYKKSAELILDEILKTMKIVAGHPPNSPDSQKAVELMLDEIDKIKYGTGDSPKSLDSKKSVVATHKPLPLTKLDSNKPMVATHKTLLTHLNPRFIVEPITFPANEHPAPRKPGKERTLHPKLYVSPVTKAALTTNYLRLLKIRRA